MYIYIGFEKSIFYGNLTCEGYESTPQEGDEDQLVHGKALNQAIKKYIACTSWLESGWELETCT